MRYGRADAVETTHVPETIEHCMPPVGTLHPLRLTELEPGKTYNFQVVSTRVVTLKSYWLATGLDIESKPFSFATFDDDKASVGISAISETHEDVPRSTR